MPVIPSGESSSVGDIQLAATCTVSTFSVAQSILTFFAVNIIGHAVTMTKRPGQKMRWTIVVGIGMILSPILMRMTYAELTVDVISACRRRWREARNHPWRRRFRIAMSGSTDVDWPLQSAIDSGAVAIEIPEHWMPHSEAARDYGEPLPVDGWSEIWSEPRYALFMDGTQVDQTKEGVQYRIVPVGTTSSSNIQFPSASSTMKTLFTIAQLIYGVAQLYASSYSNIRQYGVGSPFIVIVPYMLGSFVNLIINMFLLEYPCILVLRPKDKLHRASTAQDVPLARIENPHTPARDDTPPEQTSILNEASASSIEANVAGGNPRLADAHAAPALSLTILELGDFTTWLQDMFGLTHLPKRPHQSHRKHFIFTGTAMIVLCLYISITLVSMTLGGTGSATVISFVLWMTFGPVIFIQYEIVHKKNHSSLYTYKAALVSRAVQVLLCMVIGLSIWGMVNLVTELIPYYSQCEDA